MLRGASVPAGFALPALVKNFEPNLPYFAIPRYVEILTGIPDTGFGRIVNHQQRESGNSDATRDFDGLRLTVSCAR